MNTAPYAAGPKALPIPIPKARLRAEQFSFRADMRERIFLSTTNLLIGIENVPRVEYALRLSKQRTHFRAVHLLQIRRAHDTVVMLRGNRTPIPQDERVHGIRKRRYNLPRARGRKIHQRDNMKISITCMPRNGIRHISLIRLKKSAELRQ